MTTKTHHAIYDELKTATEQMIAVSDRLRSLANEVRNEGSLEASLLTTMLYDVQTPMSDVKKTLRALTSSYGNHLHATTPANQQ